MKRAALLLLGLIALAPVGWAGEGRTFFGLTFPEKIGGATYSGFQDHESRAAGLGYGLVYTRADWRITVYIYDFGLSAIPDDLTSRPVREHFEQAKGDISSVGYEKVEAGPEFTVPLGGGRKLQCAAYTITAAVHRFHGADSVLCLTVRENKFVKFRITVPHTGTSLRETEEFLAAWSTVLGS
jgi:hypothetical protein